jgi:hypothetical protein
MNVRTPEKVYHCPICKEKSVGGCRCKRTEKWCKNKHIWHQCSVHNKIVVGSSHNIEPKEDGCTCKNE